MVRTGVSVAIAVLLMIAVVAVPRLNEPKGSVEVEQLAESTARAGSVEVKELPAPDAGKRKAHVEVKQLPAPDAAVRRAGRKS